MRKLSADERLTAASVADASVSDPANAIVSVGADRCHFASLLRHCDGAIAGRLEDECDREREIQRSTFVCVVSTWNSSLRRVASEAKERVAACSRPPELPRTVPASCCLDDGVVG